ncbi:MAG: hypothetical protein ACRER7_09720 [Gammaproteobacteria bacterium]
MPILAKVLIAAMLLMASALGNTESRWQNLRAVQAAERQFIGLRLPPGIKVLHDLHYGAVATRSRAPDSMAGKRVQSAAEIREAQKKRIRDRRD